MSVEAYSPWSSSIAPVITHSKIASTDMHHREIDEDDEDAAAAVAENNLPSGHSSFKLASSDLSDNTVDTSPSSIDGYDSDDENTPTQPASLRDTVQQSIQEEDEDDEEGPSCQGTLTTLQPTVAVNTTEAHSINRSITTLDPRADVYSLHKQLEVPARVRDASLKQKALTRSLILKKSVPEILPAHELPITTETAEKVHSSPGKVDSQDDFETKPESFEPQMDDVDPISSTPDELIKNDYLSLHSAPALTRRSSLVTRPRPPAAGITSYSMPDPPSRRRTRQSVDGTRLRSSFSIIRSATLRRQRDTNTDDDRVLVGNRISEGHQNYVLAYNMLTGIRVAVSGNAGVMPKLAPADFTAVRKLSFDTNGSEVTPSSRYDFKFKDYAPKVFREMRSLFNLDPADYLVSITGKYILSELGSPGKSGSFFYYSRDFRFIIKTIKHSEHKQLLRILERYHAHVKNNPNTLVLQFYGLHRIKMPLGHGGSRKVHFVVMNNLFAPHRDIHTKYDLKGSTWGRSTPMPPVNPNGDYDLSQLTLKDLNWLERKDVIKFGPIKRRVFFEQLDRDVKFLEEVNVMDYSLLLGIHDTRQGNRCDTAQKLSVFDPKSTEKADIINTEPRDIDREHELPGNAYPGRSASVFYGEDGGTRATDDENMPMLEIYYLGIIDCLTNYSVRKLIETSWRSMRHARATISAVPAREYGARFLAFIKTGTRIVSREAE